MSLILTPKLSSTETSYNVGMAETFSWVPIENNAGRPLFARASYVTNLSDLSVSFTASNITIPGGVEIIDGDNSNIKATIVALEPGQGTALKVITQDLESSVDDITIGDRDGNLAEVDSDLNALKVINFKKFGTYNAVDYFNGWGSDNTLRPVFSFKKVDGSVLKLANFQLTTSAGIFGYEWRQGDLNVSNGGGVPSWTTLGEHGSYRIYSNTSIFTNGTSTKRHSGILTSTSKIEFNPLTENGVTDTQVWTLCIKRLDSSSSQNVYFSFTLEEFD